MSDMPSRATGRGSAAVGVAAGRRRGGPTRVLLEHPALELDDGVGEGAAVLALAAVAHLVAAHVELAQRVQRAHLAVTNVG